MPETRARAPLSLRNVRHATVRALDTTDQHARLLNDGIVPALRAAETLLTETRTRLDAVEAVLRGGWRVRLRWLVRGMR